MKQIPLLVGLLLLASLPAHSQQSGGIKVQGNTKINANAENVNTLAVGSGNVAKTRIGTVSGKNVRGNTNVTVDVKNVSNVVAGHGRKGCVNIGTRGDPSCE